MADNKTKIDRLHDLMPRHYKTRQNPNWRAIIEALGEVDQSTADLIEEIRKQFENLMGVSHWVSSFYFLGKDAAENLKDPPLYIDRKQAIALGEEWLQIRMELLELRKQIDAELKLV